MRPGEFFTATVRPIDAIKQAVDWVRHQWDSLRKGSRRRLFIVVGSIGGVFLLLLGLFIRGGPSARAFLSAMTVPAVAVVVLPVLCEYRLSKRGRIVCAAVEVAGYSVLFLTVGIWIYGVTLVRPWIQHVAGMILLLDGGSHLLEWHKQQILQRICSRETEFPCKEDCISHHENMFRHEAMLYLSLPVGLIAGAVASLNGHLLPGAFLFALQGSLFFASLFLLIFLLIAFVGMWDPCMRIDNRMKLSIGQLDVPTKDEDLDGYVDPAIAITDLRKMALYNAIHNVFLLVSFVAILLAMSGRPLPTKWVIALALGTTFVFNQLPYVRGQFFLHERMLEKAPETGVKRAKAAKKLKEFAPLLPTVDFLAAMLASSTAGGYMLYFFDQFITSTLIPSQ